MPITQAQKDGIVGKIGELETLVNALVADQPAQDVPPVTANTYISIAHPGVLVSNGGSYKWQIGGSPDAQGLSAFIANGSFGAMVKGTKLVLQNDRVYAKQLDGTWLLGPGSAKATVTVLEPAGA